MQKIKVDESQINRSGVNYTQSFAPILSNLPLQSYLLLPNKLLKNFTR